MEPFFLFLFIGFNSYITLITSNSVYKRQSFLLGFTGAVIGGVLALVMQRGFAPDTIEIVLLLLIAESLLFVLLLKMLPAKRSMF